MLRSGFGIRSEHIRLYRVMFPATSYIAGVRRTIIDD
jgi:hypothetical protein